MEMPNNLKQIENMSWESLIDLAKKELATVPVRDRVAFETLFKLKWPQFEQAIISLAGDTYKKISQIQERMSMLGDFSGKDVAELTMISTLNTTQYKSPKIEYYLICRALHTRESRK